MLNWGNGGRWGVCRPMGYPSTQSGGTSINSFSPPPPPKSGVLQANGAVQHWAEAPNYDKVRDDVG